MRDFKENCTTIHRYPIFSTRYSVMCKVYTGNCGTSEIEHGLCACTVDNPLAKARGLSLRTGAHTLSLTCICVLLRNSFKIYIYRYIYVCQYFQQQSISYRRSGLRCNILNIYLKLGKKNPRKRGPVKLFSK